MVRIVSLSVLLALIVILGVTFFQVLAPFLLPLFLAGVFAILCQPLQGYFLDRTRHRVRLASALTTGTIVAIILVPLAVITTLASLQLFVVASRLSDPTWTGTFRKMTEPVLLEVAEFVNDRVVEPPVEPGAADVGDAGETSGEIEETESVPPEKAQFPAEDDAGPRPARPPPDQPTDQDEAAAGPGEPKAAETARDDDVRVVEVTPAVLRARLGERVRESLFDIGAKSLGTAGRTITGVIDILSSAAVSVISAIVSFLIFVIAVYYFLADGTALLAASEKLIPVHVDYQREMLDQFARVVRSVVVATFVAGLVQGLATVLALWVFGFEHLFVLLILSILSALIPMMGTWLVWGPCALWLLWNGHWIQASVLTLYGAVLVGMLDNVVRTYILNTDAKLHPLLALISVLGGLQAMGLWGMFIGPIIASCLHALVKIFNHELALLSQEKFAVAASETARSTTSQGSSPRDDTPRRKPDAPPKTSETMSESTKRVNKE